MLYQRLTTLGVAALVAAASVSASPMVGGAKGRCRAGYNKAVSHAPTSNEATSSISPPVELPEAPTHPSAAPIIPTVDEDPDASSSSSSSTTPALPSSSATQEQDTVPAASAEPATAAPETINKAAAAASSSSSTTHSGKATFYGGNVSGGTCSFTGYTLPSGLFGTAYSGAAWNNAAECGACVSVKGPNGKTIKAMIVDQCPECEADHLDLFQNAFTQLADVSKGIIPITWSFVDCGITSPLVLKNKEGTSRYWFSMQVMNANEPVAKLEVSTDGGKTWQGTTRTSYNFFEKSSGFGKDTVDVRVTGQSGATLTVNNVGTSAGSTVTAKSNL
ncbi:putative extracellular cellulase CelA/allergen Asp F7-like [Aspergillus novofumigatus IBT 16806]|uniref:Putative extracellular cellulase CelA n=1 Tax=Aspergillus novofumigatus (strain IBT 16806) TaxID=1392255 RepID=A0A2I1CHF9_ASPN1|nr:putative extracellular cellulase CelA [Aspergillus novofumigatus IBT 16806]PKX97065.1 putative extracellular cellulase CelA [Aspergillus novofumigatus IBT 16806]